MTKKWLMENWEQDWDQENIYYTVSQEGKIVVCNIETMDVVEFNL
ncbi:hypothetical protein [Siminovitchia fordii]|uniref:Uncharacterized protein n=1 Tax=Siminovitchia fordii TaxID=254759 RepID=A0ABQ4KA85_9BACI|nr:hypothetical protein [Siminovitchia fordii]GIN22639.1 hypothetical protein J1TS3_37730 [Siminovitchia fordii]